MAVQKASLSYDTGAPTRLDLQLGVSDRGHSLELTEWVGEDSISSAGIL